MMEYWNSG